MKKIFKFTPIIALAAVLFAGCNPELEDKAYVYFSVDSETENSRTVLPYQYQSENFNYELWGRKVTGLSVLEAMNAPQVKLGSWVNYSALKSAKALELTVDTWEFECRAFKNNSLILSDSKTVEVTKNTSVVTFNLKEVAGKGGLRFELYSPLSYSTMYGKVSLTKLNPAEGEDPVVWSYTSGNTYSSSAPFYVIESQDDKGIVSRVNKADIEAGTYLLTIQLGLDANLTTFTDTYTNVVKIAKENDTYGSDTITNVKYPKKIPEIYHDGKYIRFNMPSSLSYVYLYYYNAADGEDWSAEEFDTSKFKEYKRVAQASEYVADRTLTNPVYYALKYYQNDENFSNVIKYEVTPESYMKHTLGFREAGTYEVQQGESNLITDYTKISIDKNSGCYFTLEVKPETRYYISSVKYNTSSSIYAGVTVDMKEDLYVYVYTENKERINTTITTEGRYFDTGDYSGTVYLGLDGTYTENTYAFRVYTK